MSREFIVGSSRDKHPKKELEQFLRDVEDKGWKVSREKGYQLLTIRRRTAPDSMV